MRGYRFVTKDLKSRHGNVQWKIGEWQKLDNDKPLNICENGFHASKKPLDSLDYIFGTRWFQCEAKGTILHDDSKFCASEMRLTKEIPIIVIKKFAVECAKHVLPIYEKKYPKDMRPREAIEMAAKYLLEPTEVNLEVLESKKTAARDAARAAVEAARTAAWVAVEAAGTAAWVTEAAWIAIEVTRTATRTAACGATRDTEATWNAERQWQNRTLKKLIKEEVSE